MMIPFLRKYWFNMIGVLILCGISFGVGWWVNEKSGDPNEALIKTAYREISTESIFNTQSGQALSYAAVRGMLSTIQDPYAELIEPQAAQNFLNTFGGKTGVVGLYAMNKNKLMVITIVYPNGSAAQAGIQLGDVLLAIDGKNLDPFDNSSETGLLLRGLPGSKVHLKMQRAGQVAEYDLVRKEQEFVTSHMLPGGIGYISLIAYNQTASQQMKQALEAIMQKKPVGLIWDLRNNEGGDMEAAQEILSYFIKDGLLFTAQLTNNRTVEFRAKGSAIAADLPLVGQDAKLRDQRQRPPRRPSLKPAAEKRSAARPSAKASSNQLYPY